MLEELPQDAEIGPWRDFSVCGREMTRHLQNVIDCAHRRAKYLIGVVLVDSVLHRVFCMTAGIN